MKRENNNNNNNNTKVINALINDIHRSKCLCKKRWWVDELRVNKIK
jgi:hypothetical protein